MTIRLIIVTILLAMLFIPLGCSDGELTVDDIAASILQEIGSVETYQMDGTITGSMDISEGGEEPDNMSVEYTGLVYQTMDITNKNMQMNMDMTMRYADEEIDDINMTMDMYIIGNMSYMYMDMGMPFMEPEWLKQEIPIEEDAYWKQEDDLQEIADVLDTYKELEIIGFDVIDSTDCQVIRVVPDAEKMWELAMSAMGEANLGMEDIAGDFTDFTDTYTQIIRDMLQNFDMKIWVATDTHLILKEETSTSIVFTPETIRALAEASGEEVDEAEIEGFNMRMDMEANQRYYSYNQPVSIELPPEAESATDITSFDFGL